ncbi:MAG: D-alanine--D-alanine ligase [Acidobacteria bacterium]|nr:D-alanine--D-alanine ligase [Acidobacteriota bacterium]
MKRVRVGIVYGGRSSEHEVSLASAAAVIAHLDPERYERFPIHVGRDGRWSLRREPRGSLTAAEAIASARSSGGGADDATGAQEVHLLARPAATQLLTVQRAGADPDGRAELGMLALDVVFPLVHGPFGEDGTLQGLLELAGVPYVGAGVLGSAAGMDKAVAKTLFAARGLPITRHVVIRAAQWDAGDTAVLDDVERRLNGPLFIKPANLGSSIGVSRAANRAELARAIKEARRFDLKILVEEAVPEPRELECGVIGNDAPEASVPGEIVPGGDFYDYESKYVDARSTGVVPAALTAAQATEVRKLAVEAYRAIEAAGMARVDFLLSRSTGRLYVSEVNTIPGFTTISMFAKLWAATGLDYARLLDRLIELAFERHRARRRLTTSLT